MIGSRKCEQCGTLFLINHNNGKDANYLWRCEDCRKVKEIEILEPTGQFGPGDNGNPLNQSTRVSPHKRAK